MLSPLQNARNPYGSAAQVLTAVCAMLGLPFGEGRDITTVSLASDQGVQSIDLHHPKSSGAILVNASFEVWPAPLRSEFKSEPGPHKLK